MTDEELESAAHDYIWLADTCSVLHTKRHDEIIAEADRRGNPEIIQRAKANRIRPIQKGKKGGAGRR